VTLEFRKVIAFWKFHRLGPLETVVRAAYRRSLCGTISTRENKSIRGKTCLTATLSTTNVTGLISDSGLHVQSPLFEFNSQKNDIEIYLTYDRRFSSYHAVKKNSVSVRKKKFNDV